MKRVVFFIAAMWCQSLGVLVATTLTVMAIHEPLSLHGTDGDDVISDIGEALQASVMPRPMALTGGFPEALVEAIRSPHLLPTNHPYYKVQEVNLLVLCKVGIAAEKTENGLLVKLDVAEMQIPPAVDLTKRQVLKLAIVAVRRTIEEYQKSQAEALEISLVINNADEKDAVLRELNAKFTVPALQTRDGG